MRIIAGWHRAMRLCPVHAFIPQRPASRSRRSVFHKWAPVLAEEWQATGSARIWEHWSPGSSRALTASAKPEDAPVKATQFFLLHTQCQQSAWSIRACGEGLASKTGVCSTPISSHQGQEGLIQTGRGCSHSTLCSLTPFCLSSFFPVCPTDSLLICYLSPRPLSLHAPFVSFWASPFLFTPYIMANSDCGT